METTTSKPATKRKTARASKEQENVTHGELEYPYLNDGLLVLNVAQLAPVIAVDTETNARDCRDGRGFVRGVSIAFTFDGQGYSHYYPFEHAHGENYTDQVLALLRQVLEAAPALCFHNAKFDIVALQTLGINVLNTWFFDTMIGAQLVNENQPLRKDLDSVALHYLGEHGKISEPALDKEKKTGFHNSTAAFVKEYAEKDAESTYRLGEALLPKVYEEAGEDYWNHKQDLIRVLIAMERRGVKVNTALASELATYGRSRLEQLKSDMGLNPGSKKDLQEAIIDRLGLPVVKETPKGAPSFDKFAMALYEPMLEKTNSPLGQQLTEYRGWQKSVSSYYQAYIDLLSPDGRLRCNYRLDTTRTGRFSCVTGDTLLPTSRGTFRMDEYRPEEGDLVLTHKGNWKPVLRKIYQGIDNVYRIRLTDGSHIDATEDHRLWTTQGWRRVQDITIGDEVVSVAEVPSGRSEGSRGDSAVHRRGQANSEASSRSNGYNLSQCAVRSEELVGAGTTEGRAGTSVLTVETGGDELDAWPERVSASRLYRSSVGRQGLSASKSGRRVHVRASMGYGTGFGPHVIAPGVSRASHRPESEEQRTGELGIGAPSGARSTAQAVQRVEGHAYVGAVPVWDIEVADDHSYWAGGVLSHNCTEPNLQQVPKVTDKPWNGRVKECLIPQDGYVLMEFDYSQLELRLGTAYAKERGLIEVFADPDRDFFTELSENLGWKRQDCKTFVYSVQYGGSKKRISDVFGVSQNEAQKMIDQYYRNYPGFKRITQQASMKAEANGKVRLWSGRYRHFINGAQEGYKALNSIIQGGSADVMEKVMVRLHKEVDHEDECRLLMQVHDAVTFEIREDLVDAYSERIISIMTDVDGATDMNWGVRFAVDGHRLESK